ERRRPKEMPASRGKAAGSAAGPSLPEAGRGTVRERTVATPDSIGRAPQGPEGRTAGRWHEVAARDGRAWGRPTGATRRRGCAAGPSLRGDGRTNPAARAPGTGRRADGLGASSAPGRRPGGGGAAPRRVGRPHPPRLA